MASVTIRQPSDSIKVKRAIEKELKALQKKANKKWVKEAIPLTKKLIDDRIGKGISPVKGGGQQTGGQARYTKYSDSYKANLPAGKRARPVNLKVTGKLRRSLKDRALTSNGYILWYISPLAKYHNELGAGKSKVTRRMLPLRGTNEKLSKTILNPIEKLYKKIFDKIK